jgi:hypothetical protein
MRTIVTINRKRLFSTDNILPLNVGDVFNYKCSKSRNLDIKVSNLTNKISSYSSNEVRENQLNYLIRNMMTIKEHEELYTNGSVKFIVVSKSIDLNHELDLNTHSLIKDDIICTCYIDVELYDQSYIRNKKMEQILD